MQFRISLHSGSGSPPAALSLLAERLGSSRDGFSFAQTAGGITATWREGGPSNRTEEERAEIGRLAALAVLRSVCEQDPDLKLGWFAVHPPR